MSENNFQIILQAMLDKVRFLANIKADIKAIQSKLTKIKLKGTLDKSATQKEVNTKIKSINPKVKIDADTTQAEKKIKKIGKQKTGTTITPKVDNTQVVSGLKQAQKETKTLWERFISGAIGANLVRMSVQRVTQAIYEAVRAVKELDKIKTNIQMVSNTSDSGVNAMMSSYNAMAKELSSTTKDVAEAAKEFLRMGESIENTNELIKSSQILSKVGMIDSADAASYLISSLKGYQVAAEDSIDIVSKLTSVDLEAAVSAGGLAEALSKCANKADNSGVTMDRLIGYTATIGETTQKSMSEVGNSFQALLSRMNNIKIGRFIDDETGESLSDTEAVLNKLGIQLRDTENTYRSFDDVLDDVGSRWKSLTKVEQNALSVAIAGTRQRENFEALMNNWANALKYSETAANSADSALERYGVYQDSIEAKTNELTAAMESLSTNIVSEELYSGIIEATTGIVEFLDKTYLLKGTLVGIMAMGLSKVFVSMGTGFITAAKNASKLTAAMELFKNGKSDDNLKKIGQACIGLSNNQLKLVLSTKGLEYEDRKLILAGKGVAEEEQEQTLTTLGFAAAEDKAKYSTFSLKNAWNSLKLAWATNKIGIVMAGITTAVSIASTIIFNYKQKLEEARQKAAELTEAYKQQQSSLDSQIKKYKELKESLDKGNLSVDETRSIKEQLLEIQNSLIDTYGTEISSVDLLNGKYQEQLGLLDKLSKKKAADYVIEHEGDYITAKKELEKVRTYRLGEVIAGIAGAKYELANYLRAYDSELLHIGTMGTNPNAISISVKANAEEADKVMHQLARDLQEWADENDIDREIIEPLQIGISKYAGKTMTDALKQHKTVYDEYMKAKILSDDTLRPLYLQSIQAVEAYNKSLSSGEGVEAAKANLDSVQQSVQNAASTLEGSQDVFENIYEAINKDAEAVYQLNQAFENDETVKGYAEQLRGLSDFDLKAINFKDNTDSPGEKAFGALIDILGLSEDEVQKLIDKLVELGYVQGKVQDAPPKEPDTFSTQLTKSQDSLDKFQSSVKSAADAYTTLLSGNYSSSELLDSIQAINKAVTDMGGTLDWDFINNQSYMDPLELLGDAIEHISEKYAKSILSGAGIDENNKFYQTLADIIKQTYEVEARFTGMNTQLDRLQSSYQTLMGILESYNKTGYISLDNLQSLLTADENLIAMLEVENGKLVLNQEAYENLVAVQLQDFKAKLNDAAAAEIEALAKDKAEKATNNNAKASEDAVSKLDAETKAFNRNTSAAIANAMTKAENAGVSEEEIQKVLDKYEEVWNAAMNNYKSDFSEFMKGSKSGSGSSSEKATDTTKEFDWIEQAIENVEKEVKELDDVVNSSYSTFSQKNDALAKEIGKVSEEIELQQKAYEEYMRKADSIGLPDNYKELVQNGAVNIEDITDEKIQEQIDAYQKWYDKAQNVSDAIKELKTDLKDLHVSAYELNTSDLKDRLDNDSITEKEYLKGLKTAYEKFYANLEDYAQQYHEAVLEYLRQEKDYLNSVASAATYLLDTEIDSIRDSADEQEEQLKKEIELLEDRKKPLQDELDALEDKVRKEELALNLQKAQYELAKAENQRTKLVKYMPDAIVI